MLVLCSLQFFVKNFKMVQNNQNFKLNFVLSTLIYIFTLHVPQTLGAAPWEPEIRTDKWGVWRHEQNKASSAVNAGKIKIVFYGDSITEGWLVHDGNNSTGEGFAIFQQLYTPLGAVNYGIGKDKTQNLLYQIADGEMTAPGLQPTLVVLMIGTNNEEDSIDDVARGIKAVIDLLREKQPSTKILLLGILPRTDAGWFTRVSNINAIISKFDDGKNLRFLDMFPFFAEEWGIVKSQLYEQDKLHLSTLGYKTWAEVMAPIFNRMLVDSLNL